MFIKLNVKDKLEQVVRKKLIENTKNKHTQSNRENIELKISLQKFLSAEVKYYIHLGGWIVTSRS